MEHYWCSFKLLNTFENRPIRVKKAGVVLAEDTLGFPAESQHFLKHEKEERRSFLILIN